MLIHIYDNLRVGDLKDRFEKCFNGLRLEFYDEESQPGTQKLIEDKERIRDIRKMHREGDLQIKSWFTVDDVEKAFTGFNLHVHVFRQQDHRWMRINSHQPARLSELIVLKKSVA